MRAAPDRVLRLHPGLDVRIHPHGASQVAVQAAKDAVGKAFSDASPAILERLANIRLDVHIVPRGTRFSDVGLDLWKGPTEPGLDPNADVRVGGVTDPDFRVIGSDGSVEPGWAQPLYQVAMTTPLAGRIGIREEYFSGPFRCGDAVHEIAHFLMFAALTNDQRGDMMDAFAERTMKGGPWLRPHAIEDVLEYFAEGATAFEQVPPPSTDVDVQRYTRAWLAANDPKLYLLLRSVYSRAERGVSAPNSGGDGGVPALATPGQVA